jgi:hypothetical protein
MDILLAGHRQLLFADLAGCSAQRSNERLTYAAENMGYIRDIYVIWMMNDRWLMVSCCIGSFLHRIME